MVPHWLHAVSEISLIAGFVCAFAIAADELRRPQKMWIMNVVWPVTALFGCVIWLGFYLRYGRMAEQAVQKAFQTSKHGRPNAPFGVVVAKACSHCGAGCTLGDICAEGIMALAPGIAVVLGYGTLFQDRIFAGWGLDFLLAYVFGIIFQYFTIAPMRNLGLAAGLWAAIKADTFSLIAWQVGMYAFMAFAHFWIFQIHYHVKLGAEMPEFWFMMQIAMTCGFATSYPVNAILLKTGLKEPM